MKLIYLKLTLIVFCFHHLNAQTVYPRTIKVTGESSTYLPIEQIDFEFYLINESEINKIKMPLSKVESQLRQQLTAKGIPSTKLELSTDPQLCNATYKQAKLIGLTLKEYQDIYPFLSKYLFTRDFNILNKKIKKESIEKIIDVLLNECIANAKLKARDIANITNEKLEKIHQIDASNTLLEVTKDYNTSMGSFDSIIAPVEYRNYILVSYSLESSENEKSTLKLPNTLQVCGKSEKIEQINKALFKFKLNLVDYEEGDVKTAFNLAKEKIQKTCTSHGVNPSQISTTTNQYYSNSDVNLNYKVSVAGIDNIESILKELNNNPNVSELEILSDEKENKETIAIDNSMSKLAIANADAKAQRIATLFDTKIKRKFDIIDDLIKNISGDSLDWDESVDTNSDKLGNLKRKKYKQIYISYELTN